MATIGQVITTPEVGWKRYDHAHKLIQYEGIGWRLSTGSGGTSYETNKPLTDTIKFTFIGNQLRLMSKTSKINSNQIEIKIDDNIDMFSENYQYSAYSKTLVYEKTGLANKKHVVEIKSMSDNSSFNLGNIDINDTGRLFHPDEIADIKDLTVGKRIRCHYQAYTDKVGDFWGLGEETSVFIPSTGSSTPNGDFYFIMVEDINGKKRLVADRNVQSGISWNTLNTVGIALDDGAAYMASISQLPAITGFTSSEGNVIYSSSYTTNPGWEIWRVFGRATSLNNPYIGIINEVTGGFVGFKFREPKKVNEVIVTGPEGRGYVGITSHVQNFDIQAWNGTEWITLLNVKEHTPISVGVRKKYQFENEFAYTQYRIANIKNGGNVSYTAIGEIDFLYCNKQEMKFTYPKMPIMNSYTKDGIVVSVDSVTDHGWKAFDGLLTSRNFWYTINTLPVGGHWLKIQYPTPKRINKIMLIALNVSGGNYSIKDFILYGSNDNVTYTELTRNTHPNNATTSYYNFENEIEYKYYRINILNSYHSIDYCVGITEMQLYEVEETMNTYRIRLLTGGISATDKDNEWDKYIVNSNLEGTIMSGDDTIWNWKTTNIATMTSSIFNGDKTKRVLRGHVSDINVYTGATATTAAVGYGFRPVLEIESRKSIQKKSLIYHDGKYKRFVGNNGNIKYSSDTVIPKMTSNTTPLGRAFSSSSYSSSFDPWKAFNQLDDNEGFASGMPSNGVGYLGYEFNKNVLIGKYLLRSVGNSSYLKNMPKTWTFEGSSNGLDWVILDTQINQTWSKVLSDKEYIIKEPSLFKMYRINVTEANAIVNYFDVNEFKMYSIEEWEAVSTTTPTVDQFQEHGMDSIPTTKLPLLGEVNNIGIVTWVSDENHSPIVKLSAIPHNQLVLPTKDINIRSIENIDYIKLTANELNHGRIRVITSLDRGLKWHTHNGMKWIEVSPIIDEAIMNGMSPTSLSAITSEQWAELRGTSNTMRFVYALSIEEITDVAEIDALTTQMDMKGTWKKAVHDKDYSYEYPNNDELLVTIYADGDYKINY